MKKIFLGLCLLSVCLCAQAASWEKITDKIYLDISGITPDAKLGNVYSFWTKELNDGTADFIISEKTHSQKVWYDLVRYSIDCSNHKIRLDDIVVYGLQNNMLSSTSLPSDQWHTIPPESIAQDYMTLVCRAGAKIKTEPVEKPAQGKVGKLGNITYTEVNPYAVQVEKQTVQQPENAVKTQSVEPKEPVVVDFDAYMKKVRTKVSGNWTHPENSGKKVTLIFTISSDGTLVTLSEFKTSGDRSFDEAATDAVKASVPFEGLPKGYSGKDIVVQLTFDSSVHGFILSK